MSNLKSRQITKQDLDEFDIIFVMDTSHYNHIKEMGVDSKKLKMFLELTPEQGVDLSDPYYTKKEEQVFKICINACNKWYQKLIKRNS